MILETIRTNPNSLIQRLKEGSLNVPEGQKLQTRDT